MPDDRKRVAGIVTEYRRWSHADVLLGKILEGYFHDGRDMPQLRLVSLYVDQTPGGDMSRALAKKHGFAIYDNVENAVTCGRKEIAVEGVIIVGEHGKYPTNARGQILYPRRRFFDAVMNVFARHRRSVPVFTDKHLAATWQDARAMYDRAQQLHVPLMAGSSVPVTWRRPPVRLPRGTELVEAVAVGYGPFEGYGFHALEGLQCLVERRRGGEVGVRRVQCLQGEEMWRAMDRGDFSRELLEAAMARVPAHANGDLRALTVKARDAGVFLIEYRDNFKAAVAMLNGWVHEGDGGAFTAALRLRGRQQPIATHFYLQQPDPFAHFAYLLRAIEAMIWTSHPSYPVERTLLTTGILDAVMISRAEKNRAVPTPHLNIRYTPNDWIFAMDPVPPAIKR
jgi:hypothetical protein